MTEENQIHVPKSLNENQVKLAQAFVQARHTTGIGVAEFCSKHGISTATWYGESYMKNPVFESYLTALGGSIISDSEAAAYQIVKKKIMQEATKANAGTREIQLFLDNFSYIVEAEKQQRMRELGIQPAHEQVEQKTLEEKKASLLSRLKG